MIQAYSWTIYQEEGVPEKIVDLSLMLDGVTGIPKEIRPFFDLDLSQDLDYQGKIAERKTNINNWKYIH